MCVALSHKVIMATREPRQWQGKWMTLREEKRAGGHCQVTGDGDLWVGPQWQA